MENIIKLHFVDEYDEYELTYYVKADNDTQTKISNLEKLLETYDSFQEVEDFIEDNFESVSITEYDFNF